MSPQVCQQIAYDGKKADVWAFGVLAYLIINGKYPFRGNYYNNRP
jgi:serine/threonine protein kinase